jgi:hypothetical protein
VEVNKNLLAPCGLYCGVCAIYIAHRDDNLKFKERLRGLYGRWSKNVEDIKCTGCMSDDVVFGFCQKCPIRDCVKGNGIEGCHQCDEWPCGMIERFPIPVGKKVLMKDIPKWRELGTEKWVEMVENRYKCPDCGNPLFRGAKRCNKCKATVDVD